MISTLSSLGFGTGTEQEFVAVAEKLAATVTVVPGDPYAVWQSSSGAELWFHVSATGSEIVGFTPFFAGESRVPLRLTARIPGPAGNPHEGLIAAELTPAPGLPGIHPLVFEAVDALRHATLVLPREEKACIVAFAHQMKAFASAAEFEQRHANDLSFAPQSFVPLGLFTGADSQPSASALIVGRVARHRQTANEITGQPFHALLVEGLDATYDVVADPQAVEGAIVVGGTVEVTGTLFGRLL
jgi:hypothetical protein